MGTEYDLQQAPSPSVETWGWREDELVCHSSKIRPRALDDNRQISVYFGLVVETWGLGPPEATQGEEDSGRQSVRVWRLSARMDYRCRASPEPGCLLGPHQSNRGLDCENLISMLLRHSVQHNNHRRECLCNRRRCLCQTVAIKIGNGLNVPHARGYLTPPRVDRRSRRTIASERLEDRMVNCSGGLNSIKSVDHATKASRRPHSHHTRHVGFQRGPNAHYRKSHRTVRAWD